MSQIRVNCPHCQQIDQVQKISAIYSGGISNSELSGKVNSSGIGYSRVNLTGQNQTYLSQMFAPPKRPSRLIGDLLRFTGAVIILSFVIDRFLTLIVRPKTFDIWYVLKVVNTLVFSFSLIAFIVILLNWLFKLCVPTTSRRTYQQKLNHWQKLCIIWDRIYYCHRCNIVYDPDKPGQVSSVKNIEKLYNQENF